MKTITTINWVIIGIYGLGLLWMLVSGAYSRQDSAGQGMLAGILLLLGLFLVALSVLNYLPHPWAKLTALLLGLLPLLLYLLGPGLDLLTTNENRKGSSEELLSRNTSAFYVQDPVQMAAIIATGNVPQLTATLNDAAEHELWNICHLLLNKGADPAYTTPDGRTIGEILDAKEMFYTNSGNVLPADFVALKERLNKLY